MEDGLEVQLGPTSLSQLSGQVLAGKGRDT